MNDYNLVPGEFVILQESNVRLGTATNSEKLTEVVLTDRNLILVNDISRGLFHSERMLKRFPLTELQRYEDEAQAPVVKQKNLFCIQAVFSDETVSILFTDGARRTAERWSRAIQQAAAGDFNNIDSSNLLPPDVTNLVDSAKDLFDALGTKQKKEPAKRNTPKPVAISGRCSGCHAPLAGQPGAIIACPYCDTRQTL